MRSSPLFIALAALAACQSTKSDALVGPKNAPAANATARKSRTFEFSYDATLDDVPAGAKQVRMWIPVPVDTADQTITNLHVDASHPTKLAAIENGRGKSLCVESHGEPVHARVTFTCTRYETHGGGQELKSELADDLQPNRMIPLDGKVAAVAATLKTEDQALETGRDLYFHTLERMKYDKPDGGQWGRGDAEWACDSRFGNCTDFHSYFMGLARSKGIPARFEMGFSIPGGAEQQAKVAGYHCWAYFWTDHDGWVPVDISEADKDNSKANYFFGTLDENRVMMTGGRDVVLSPRPSCGSLNFFVYPYAEVDGADTSKAVKRAFSRTLVAN